MDAPFRQLDFLYTPSRDVAADARHMEDVLGGEVVFAVEAMGVRVAGIRLAQDGPLVLLTDHLDDERTVFIYRVDDLDQALSALESQGWQREHTFGIPHGPCCSFRTPGGQRIALYQLARPGAANHFDGRRDF
jgi:hypothetical protein